MEQLASVLDGNEDYEALRLEFSRAAAKGQAWFQGEELGDNRPLAVAGPTTRVTATMEKPTRSTQPRQPISRYAGDNWSQA